MKHTVPTAGKSRKTHKSRKTTAPESASPKSSVVSDRKPSLPALTTATLPDPPNTLALILSTAKDKTDEAIGVDTGVPTVEPKKQWWLRHPDSKARKHAEKIMVLRAAGHKDEAIAKKMKTTAGTVQQIVYIARKNGWLDDNDEPVDIEAEMAFDIDRKVVRNISSSLDGQMTNWQTHEMTLAAAKGRGHFKNHEASRGDSSEAVMQMVAIQIIMPPVGAGDQMPAVDEAQMGGVPAFLEGDIEGC